MAGEQSCGTFVAGPRRDAGAEGARGRPVEALEVVGEAAEPVAARRGRAEASAAPRAGAGHPVLAARQHGAVAAEPGGDGRRQSLRAEAVLRPAPPRHAPAGGVRRRLSRPAVRHRGHAPPRRRRGAAADRDDHQAERRARRRRRRQRWSRRCARPASTSSRTTSCRRTAPPARSTTRARAVMRVDQRACRPHRQEGDVRLQPHRRARRDAPPPRPRARSSAAPA